MSTYTNEQKTAMTEHLCDWHIRIRQLEGKCILYNGRTVYELFPSGTLRFNDMAGGVVSMKLGKRAAHRIVAAHVNHTDWWNAVMWNMRQCAVMAVSDGASATDVHLELRPYVQEVIDSGKDNPYIA